MPDDLQPIAARVCAAKAEIGAIKKAGFNKHGGYHHSTVDDVYHLVRPILAKHGLDLRCSVTSREKVPLTGGSGKTTNYVNFHFEIGFAAADGAAEDPDSRFLTLPFTGPQTDEIAVSYVQKQYLRSRLQIETGDFESEDALGVGGNDMPAAVSTITDDQIVWIERNLKATNSDVVKFCQAYGIAAIADLPSARWPEASRQIERKLTAQEAAQPGESAA